MLIAMIYLDYGATTPISEKALAMYNQVSVDYFGNTQSLHDVGSKSKNLLEVCRKELATFIKATTESIYFTAGGTDSNVLAIRSLLKGASENKKHIITSSVEHSSVLNTMQALQDEGYDVTYLPVNKDGEIEVNKVKEAISSDTALVCLTHVNSEIGTIQPITAIGKLLGEAGIAFHVDAVQSLGKLEIDVEAAKITSLAISSHKIYGPKGVGACYISSNASWKPLLAKTTHENGFRPGTVNVPGIAAFVTAASEAVSSIEENQAKYKTLREAFIRQLISENIIVEEHSKSEKQMPAIIGLRLKGIEGQYVMLECNRRGVAISTGSACQVGKNSPSKTMLALGRNKNEANEFIRISFGRDTTEEQLTEVVKVLHEIDKSFHDKGV
jgi:cysteine desulfurase